MAHAAARLMQSLHALDNPRTLHLNAERAFFVLHIMQWTLIWDLAAALRPCSGVGRRRLSILWGAVLGLGEKGEDAICVVFSDTVFFVRTSCTSTCQSVFEVFKYP